MNYLSLIGFMDLGWQQLALAGNIEDIQRVMFDLNNGQP